MSEEEKKVVDIIKNEITRPDTTPLEVYVTDIKILLSLINKQQKEIEHLNLCLDCEEKASEGLREDIKSLLQIEPNDNFIHKDKIREIIKELIKQANYRTIDNPKGRVHFHKEPVDYQIQVLEELLEE